MAERREQREEPDWPRHLAEYRPDDGWEHKLDWEIARAKWARSQGFKQFKILPLIQAMTKNPARREDDA